MSEERRIPREAVSANYSRPYRSHEYPACDFCRRRKSRCARDLDQLQCLLCAAHGIECTWNGSSVQRAVTRGEGRKRRCRQSQQRKDASLPRQTNAPLTENGVHATRASLWNEMSPEQEQEQASASAWRGPEAQIQSGHIVGPAVARDVQVLDEYMSLMDALAALNV